ncbi:hypothetical protein SUGI_0124380 [Cryptomeria japonica]|nr:hypothetical protein SUGI_0124380 [Cryptomeria japonica]
MASSEVVSSNVSPHINHLVGVSMVCSTSDSFPTSSHSAHSTNSFMVGSFSSLVSPSPLVVRNWESKLVLNLSSAFLDPLSFNILKRGHNFSLAPHIIPHIGFLIEIESAIRSLPSGVAEEVRLSRGPQTC